MKQFFGRHCKSEESNERNEHEIENFQENHLGNDEEYLFIAPFELTSWTGHKAINAWKLS